MNKNLLWIVHIPIGDINMSAQMIELEEVQMMEVSDAAFEEAEVVTGGVYSTWAYGSKCGNL